MKNKTAFKIFNYELNGYNKNEVDLQLASLNSKIHELNRKIKILEDENNRLINEKNNLIALNEEKILFEKMKGN